MSKSFGDILRALRFEHKLTQPELAKILNVSKSTISTWENNLCEPVLSNLIAIAKYFKVELDYLAGLID